MKVTSKTISANGSLTFGPFAVGDVVERVSIFGRGAAAAGSKATVLTSAGDGALKSDADLKQSGGIALDASTSLVPVEGDLHHEIVFWQKIESGKSWITVSVAYNGFVANPVLTIGVSVRPVFKVSGFRQKSKAGMSITSDQAS